MDIPLELFVFAMTVTVGLIGTLAGVVYKGQNKKIDTVCKDTSKLESKHDKEIKEIYQSIDRNNRRIYDKLDNIISEYKNDHDQVIVAWNEIQTMQKDIKNIREKVDAIYQHDGFGK